MELIIPPDRQHKAKFTTKCFVPMISDWPWILIIYLNICKPHNPIFPILYHHFFNFDNPQTWMTRSRSKFILGCGYEKNYETPYNDLNYWSDRMNDNRDHEITFISLFLIFILFRRLPFHRLILGSIMWTFLISCFGSSILGCPEIDSYAKIRKSANPWDRKKGLNYKVL